MDEESVKVSPVRENGDTEESLASSIEDGRKESHKETAPEVSNKLKSIDIVVRKFHLLILMKKHQAIQRQLAGLLGQEVADFLLILVEFQSHPTIPFRLPVIEEDQVNCEICHRKLSSHCRLKKYMDLTWQGHWS